MHFEVLMRNVLEKEQNWQVVSNIHDIKFTKDGSLHSSHSKSELLLLSRATRSVAPLPASEMAIPLQPRVSWEPWACISVFQLLKQQNIYNPT